jgi:hypothetical protein
MENAALGTLDYERIVKEAGECSMGNLIGFLTEELPYVWRDAYLKMTQRTTEIVRMQRGSFEYIYDDYATLEARVPSLLVQ